MVDVFTWQWLAFVLADRARYEAMMSVNNAVASAKPALPGLALCAGNGTQYTSRDFGQSTKALDIKLECICVNTPEQNGHVESFHKTLKKEYAWNREFADMAEAEAALRAAFENYNNYRIHSSLGYLAPAEFADLWWQ